MKKSSIVTILLTTALVPLSLQTATAQPALIAKGTLTSSRAGSYADLSGLKGTLENGAAANLLGGFGSGIAHISGDQFVAVPDRGPNAIPFDSDIDDTVSYINRFHTIKMNLKPSPGSALPYTINPDLESTTLLFNLTPLSYGSGVGLGVGSGEPRQNNFLQHYFTGRSDNFNPNRNSGDASDARLDPESIRVSNDGLSIFISDEYGPYVYQFLRSSGLRIRTFQLPEKFFVSTLSPMGAVEIANNTSGRVANKGMEGLAITPDGRTLVGIVQNALIQDANDGASSLLRIVTIDIASGRTTHEYAYLLTTGSGVSDIVALNDHEFLVDERDGKGLADVPGEKAKIKQIFKIDLKGATDISDMTGSVAQTHPVTKSLFLDIVKSLNNAGITSDQIPAKIEGTAFGPDVVVGGVKMHTFWVANDNDFDQNFNNVPNSNPNFFYVFGVKDSDLDGSTYVAQQIPSFDLSPIRGGFFF
ncbi:MAG: esterase-like activity of phytase family protein [Edaphobacter sp.]